MKTLTIQEIDKVREWLLLEADYNANAADGEMFRLADMGLYELKVLRENQNKQHSRLTP